MRVSCWTNALRDADEDVRAEATTLMGKLNESEWAIPLLLPNLQDEAALVRKNAALSLMKLENPSVIGQLQQCMETGATRRRCGAQTRCESAQPRRVNRSACVIHVMSHPWCSRRALHAQLRDEG